MSLPSSQELVIVGGGMASGRLVETLLARGYDRNICWIGAESQFGYNRVLLPDHLSGRCSDTDLGAAPSASNLHSIAATSVERIDSNTQSVMLSTGQRFDYKRLVLATGGAAPLPNCPGTGLDGVLTLRSLADSKAMKRRAARSRRAIVVGGGLLGLEAGKALLDLGLQVQVIHRRECLLNRQLDTAGSDLLQQALVNLGFTIRCNAEIAQIRGSGECQSVMLRDGSEHSADLVVFATGTRPEIRLAEQAGLECDQGVVTNTALQTSDPHIYAIGECAQVASTCYALVEPIFRQADVLATRLMGEIDTFAPPANSTRLKVAGIALFAAGNFGAESTPRAKQNIVIQDSQKGLYRRLMFEEHRLTAAVLLGEITGSRAIADAMYTTIHSPQQRQQLAFGTATL